MNPGSNRLLLSISLALTACTILSPLEVLAAGPTGEPLSRQALEQMIEQYIRSHPEVIEQSLQSLENKRGTPTPGAVYSWSGGGNPIPNSNSNN